MGPGEVVICAGCAGCGGRVVVSVMCWVWGLGGSGGCDVLGGGGGGGGGYDVLGVGVMVVG